MVHTLSFSDRIRGVSLLYLFQSLPVEIPPKQFCEWDRLISRYIWGGKRPRVRYSTLQLPKEKGGMALSDLKNYFYAAQTRPIFYWCTCSYIAKWKDIETNIQDLQVQSFIREREIHGHSKDKLGPIVTFSLKIWHAIVKHFKLEKEIGIFRWITHYEEFKPGREDLIFQQWKERRITTLCSVLTKGEIKSSQDLKDDFGLRNQDLFSSMDSANIIEYKHKGKCIKLNSKK